MYTLCYHPSGRGFDQGASAKIVLTANVGMLVTSELPNNTDVETRQRLLA